MKPDFSRHDEDANYTQAKHRKPRNESRRRIAAICDAMRGGFGIFTVPISRADSSAQSVAWLLFRCQTAQDKWRDEFAGLLERWLTYWRAGYSVQRIADCLGLNRTDQEWLRAEVRKFIDLGPPPRIPHGNPPFRKMKRGLAADIVRRRRLAYKQSQSLKPQQDSPFS